MTKETEVRWVERIREWRASGLSAEAFAMTRGYKASTLCWAASRAEHEKRRERGLVATALGYSIRHEKALRRFLDDGRLRMGNNSAERQLKAVAVGRREWLFYGSDDHAGAAGNTLSLIASCKLHRLDPELYLAEIIRVLRYRPRDRYLELAPKYWRATRARLSPEELKLPLGPITVPPPPSKEQPSSN
jgi:hypothetical protein